MDDGSTDGSAAVLAGYSDPRIKGFSFPKNIGRTPALRHAFGQASGEYVAVLDADDISHPERLKRQVEFLDSRPDVVLVGTWAERIDEQGRVIDHWQPPVKTEELYDRLGWLNPIVHSSAMYRKEAAEAAGGYPEQYSYAQDYALILSLAAKGRIAVIDEDLCRSRISPGRMTSSVKYRLTIASEELALMERAGKTITLSEEGRYMNRRTVAKCEMRYGRLLFINGDHWAGLKNLASGMVKLWGSGR